MADNDLVLGLARLGVAETLAAGNADGPASTVAELAPLAAGGHGAGAQPSPLPGFAIGLEQAPVRTTTAEFWESMLEGGLKHQLSYAVYPDQVEWMQGRNPLLRSSRLDAVWSPQICAVRLPQWTHIPTGMEMHFVKAIRALFGIPPPKSWGDNAYWLDASLGRLLENANLTLVTLKPEAALARHAGGDCGATSAAEQMWMPLLQLSSQVLAKSRYSASESVGSGGATLADLCGGAAPTTLAEHEALAYKVSCEVTAAQATNWEDTTVYPTLLQGAARAAVREAHEERSQRVMISTVKFMPRRLHSRKGAVASGCAGVVVDGPKLHFVFFADAEHISVAPAAMAAVATASAGAAPGAATGPADGPAGGAGHALASPARGAAAIAAPAASTDGINTQAAPPPTAPTEQWWSVSHTEAMYLSVGPPVTAPGRSFTPTGRIVIYRRHDAVEYEDAPAGGFPRPPTPTIKVEGPDGHKKPAVSAPVADRWRDLGNFRAGKATGRW
jgi:hypothetical protein